MIRLKTSFTRRELVWFGPIFALFAVLLSSIALWKFEAPTVAIWICLVAGVVITIYYLVPPLRRFLFMAWLGAVFPIGWVLSHLLLAVVFYLVVTPIGLLLRLFRYDALRRRFDRSAQSYWIERGSAPEPKSYFRQL